MSDVERDFRSGFVGMAGVPNVGKSTLVNKLVGQKVSITSRCPQTTRHRICGILTTDRIQAVLVDMPGVLSTEDGFNLALVDCARRALEGCDLVLHLRAAESARSDDETQLVDMLAAIRCPLWQVWNKVDLGRPEPAGAGVMRPIPYERTFFISAKTGAGLDELKRAFARALPPGPMLYPPDEVSDRDLRFLCAEFVREKIFARLRQEVPYGIATWTETWEERPGGLTYIRVVIQTEREVHKRIIVGSGGKMLKGIGSHSRAEIEKLVGGPVYLDLWVRVKPKWRKDQTELDRLGLRSRR